jgi:hypothetical protein
MSRRFAGSLALSFAAAWAGVALVALPTACSSTLSQPFEQLKQQPITIYRLQNFEPPQAQAGAPVGLPSLPPQIQQWLGAGAQLLPPGLLPPGLIPGSAGAPPPQDAPRFYNFRILGTMNVTDSKMHDEILSLFGKDSNFETPKQACMYAEFGFQIGQGPPPGTPQGAPVASPPADILVSLSCDQVQMSNYGWPYGAKTGLPSDTSKRLHDIIRRAFGG